MYLIEHHHSIGQPPEPHEVMFDIQHREERLIDGAHSIGRSAVACDGRTSGRLLLPHSAIFTPHVLERGHHLLTNGATVDQTESGAEPCTKASINWRARANGALPVAWVGKAR